jgi:serine/threonine protein kinase
MDRFEYHTHKEAEKEHESLEHHGQRIIELLQNSESELGRGRTARAHHGLASPKVCYKIIPDVKSEFYNQGFLYTDVEGEAKFLEDLQGIDANVRVPKVYGTIEVYDPKRIDVLVMERLDAVSIDDVLKMRDALPPSFALEDFFKKLKAFIETMHNKGIYHRDLHEGNIMIDKETGNPCVIDFGSSKKLYFGDENPYVEEESLRGKRHYFTDDFEWMKKVRLLLSEHIRLTKEEK